MPDPLLIRDVMRIGVPTRKMEDTLQQIAALMVSHGYLHSLTKTHLVSTIGV